MKAIRLKLAITTVLLSLVAGVFAQSFPSPTTLITVWNPNGTLLAVGGTEGLRVIDTATGQDLSGFQVSSSPVYAVAWSPDGSQVASSGEDGSIDIWNVTDGAPITSLTGHDFRLSYMQWSPDGTRLATGNTAMDESFSLRIWDTSNYQLLNQITGGHIAELLWIDSERVIVVTTIGGPLIFDLSFPPMPGTDLSPYRFGPHESSGSIALHPNNNILAIGSFHRPVIYLWDISTNQLLKTLEGHTDYVLDMDWHPDGEQLTSVGLDGTLRSWDANSGQQTTVTNIGAKLYSVSWHPEGQQLAYGGETPDGITDIFKIVYFPTAHAGIPQTLTADINNIATVTLDGSASVDPDGEIVSYVWTLDGIEIATGAITDVTLNVGVHEITLTVTDNEGAVGVDTVIITIEAQPVAQCLATVSDGQGLINAINDANNNGSSHDTICLENSVYTWSSASNMTALPAITTPITIVGNGATLERGNGANYRFFNVTTGGELTLENLTLRNGNAGGNNGGAIINTGRLTLDDVTLTDNTARFGGGIHSNGFITITDSAFSNNRGVENGGAILIENGALSIQQATFENNNARYGSGIYLNNGNANLTTVTFNTNRATEQGAGVYQRSGSLSITDGIIENNTARFGNGVYIEAGITAITGLNASNNITTEEGGVIYNRNGTLSVVDSTLTNNRARFGGAISNRGTLHVLNSIFNSNQATESGGAIYNTSNNSANRVEQSCFAENTARFGGAVFSSTNNFNVQDNWWGSETGATSAMVNNRVLFMPFIADGCPN